MKQGGWVVRLAWLAVVCLVGVAGIAMPVHAEEASGGLPQDAYIWQRRWTGALTDALQSSTPLIRQWRVLAIDVAANGNVSRAKPDLAALKAAGRPVVTVFRINGRLDSWDLSELVDRLWEEWTEWQKSGFPLQTLEIDHDAPTAQLPHYVKFLRMLRAELPAEVKLSVTALPTWLGSPSFDEVLNISDESVLQVHAVLDPMRGLFDPEQALAWAQAYGRRTQHPWRLALPAYGSRVAWNDRGRVIAVESERSVPVSGAESRELVAVPEMLAGFLRTLERQPPPRMQAVVWFRLPTGEDRRAWSLAAWQAVVKREPLHHDLKATLRPAESAGLFDIVLSNDGNIDERLPLQVYLPSGCEAADGVNGYALGHDSRGILLIRRQDGLLHVGRQRPVGWLRCADAGAAVTLKR